MFLSGFFKRVIRHFHVNKDRAARDCPMIQSFSCRAGTEGIPCFVVSISETKYKNVHFASVIKAGGTLGEIYGLMFLQLDIGLSSPRY